MLVSAMIETPQPICIERWEDYKMLGRFTLRDQGKTVSPGGEVIQEEVASWAARLWRVGCGLSRAGADELAESSH